MAARVTYLEGVLGIFLRVCFSEIAHVSTDGGLGSGNRRVSAWWTYNGKLHSRESQDARGTWLSPQHY